MENPEPMDHQETLVIVEQQDHLEHPVNQVQLAPMGWLDHLEDAIIAHHLGLLLAIKSILDIAPAATSVPPPEIVDVLISLFFHGIF